MNTVDIVRTVLKHHPPECVFDQTPERIAQAIDAQNPPDEEQFLDAAVRAIRNAEIYCPHEGIGT